MRFRSAFFAALLAASGSRLSAEQAPAAPPAAAVEEPKRTQHPQRSGDDERSDEPEPPDPPAEPPPPDPPAEPGDVLYRADRVSYDSRARIVHLDGNVVVERAGGRLYAARGRLDRGAGTLLLEGGVLAVQGLQIGLADGAVIDLRSQAAELVGATLFLKDPAAGPQLATLTQRSAARATGRNALTIKGRSVEKLADGSVLARDVTLTPCDCAGRPDYDLLAREVRIDRDRARLPGARLRLFGVPVPFGIPVSLPLTNRQTGLLGPRFGVALTSGFGIVQPLFVTLGRSWDVTVAPGWFTGAARADEPGGGAPPNYHAGLFRRTVRGPRLDVELRGAPVQGTTLRLAVDAFHDLDAGASEASTANAFGVPGSSAGRGFGGFRGVLRASERTEASWGTVALEGAVASDAMVLADAQPAVIDRFSESLRTDAGAWGRAGPAIVGVHATLLQDVRLNNPAFPDRRAFGAEARRTFQRLPALFVQLPAVALAGGLRAGGELSVARFMPFRSVDPQEVQTGFGPTDSVAAPHLLTATPVEGRWGLSRAPVTRVDVAPRLSAELASGRFGAVSAIAGGRADAWWFDEEPARARRRAYGLFGLRAETELSRSLGAVVHTVVPSLEVRALTPSLGGGGAPIGDPTDAGGQRYTADPAAAQQGIPQGLGLRAAEGGFTAGVPAARRPYDELDGAAPERGAGQAVLRIDQALWRAAAPGRAPSRVVELTLAQNVLLWAGGGRGRLGEGWAAASGRVGPVDLGARAMFDWSSSEVSGAAASIRLSDQRGDAVFGSLQALRSSAPELIRAGADELFSTARLASTSGALTGSASAGVAVRLPLTRPAVSLAWSVDRLLGTLQKGTPDTIHHLTASIDSPCRCAGLQAALDLPYADGALGTVGVRFVLDLKQLGSFGTP